MHEADNCDDNDRNNDDNDDDHDDGVWDTRSCAYSSVVLKHILGLVAAGCDKTSASAGEQRQCMIHGDSASA